MSESPTLSLWIDGKPEVSSNQFDNINPYDNSLICKVHSASPEHIERAVKSAKSAQAKWAQMPFKERAQILRRTSVLLREKNDELALIETGDTGRPLRETKEVDIVSAADCLDYIASLIEVRSSRHIPLGQEAFAYTLEQPLGICLGIGAWNYPLQVATWKAAPALAMGNAFIFKPSEFTPRSAISLAELFQEAGLPAGLFQVLHGDGKVGKALVEHPNIAKVSLTGSVPTGKKIYQNAASNLKKVSLELGGKSPLIIFKDADLAGAVQSTLLANFYSQGEICSNGTRVFVEEGLKDKFCSALIKEISKIKKGDPLDPKTELGPLIHTQHKDQVMQAIEEAKAQGAKILTGGKSEGNFVEPTLLDDCSDEMACVQNEIFGPVLSLLTFKSEDEVIERANKTSFGLAGGVFTRDLARAHRVAEALEVGVSWINAFNLTPVEMPFGGAKQSGLGSENGHEVLKEYSRTQAIYVNKSDSYDSFF